jgi:hypothetical protein
VGLDAEADGTVVRVGESDAVEPEVPRTPRAIRRFETWDEFPAFIGDAPPSRPDDVGVVFEGTNGRRATLEEILAYIEEHRRRQSESDGVT